MSTTHSGALLIIRRGRLSRVYREGGAWRQVADAIEAGIRAGAYPVGQRLPSIEVIAQDHHVGRGTVQTALSWLQDHGLIEVTHGKPTIVIARTPTGETRTVDEVLTDHSGRIGALEDEVKRLRARLSRIERGDG